MTDAERTVDTDKEAKALAKRQSISWDDADEILRDALRHVAAKGKADE